MSNPKQNSAIYTEEGNCVTPLGFTLEENIEQIKKGNSAIQKHSDKNLADQDFYGAIIDKKQVNEAFGKLKFEGDFSDLEKMLLLAIEPLLTKYKSYINEDCGIIFSTTKGNINALEQGSTQSYYLQDLAQKISKAIGIKNEPIVLSNACVSGIMAVSVAKRLIHIGKYKHCIIVGGDLFSQFVFSGFQSFQAVSSSPCKPYDKKRDGITLGEAASALFVSSVREAFSSPMIFEIIGEGSINDANHISGPSRTGEGLYQSIQSALKEAKISPLDIDSISAHGTATAYNDEMEAKAFNRCDLQSVPVFSLKSCFGHTLGAAGLLETVITLAFSQENLIPPSMNYEEHGVSLPLAISAEVVEKEIHCFLKTASGFGGTNTAVIFKKVKNENV